MKKLMIATITVVSLGLFSAQAMAWGGGYCGGRGQGGGWYGGNTPESPAKAESYEKFMNETAQTRQQLAAKQGEYRAVMRQDNPDPQKASALSADIESLREQLRTKAGEYELNAPGSYDGARNAYCYGPKGNFGPKNPYRGGYGGRGPGHRSW